MPMSNTGRRRRSTRSVAPSRTTSPSPSGRREPQPSRIPQWKFSQVLGELPPAAEAHRDGAPCPQDDDGVYQSINVCILKHQS
jgi:serine/threonine-protein phosphatase 2A regulatory subunit B